MVQKECKLQQTISFLQHDLEVKAKSNANALKAQNMFLKNLENQNSGKKGQDLSTCSSPIDSRWPRTLASSRTDDRTSDSPKAHAFIGGLFWTLTNLSSQAFKIHPWSFLKRSIWSTWVKRWRIMLKKKSTGRITCWPSTMQTSFSKTKTFQK